MHLFTKEDWCMKKILKIVSAALGLGLILEVTSCDLIFSDKLKLKEQQIIETTETGSACFNLVIPDYYGMAANLSGDARAIAPQTAKVRLSYKKIGKSEWLTHDTVNLSEAEKTAVPNAPEGFAGSVYKLTFKNIPSGNYAAGTMKIDLLDANGKLISSGTNSDVVCIIMGETTKAAFYTIPETADSKSTTLTVGEMKFCKIDLLEAIELKFKPKLKVSVPEGKAYPYVAIFDKNGAFEKLTELTAESNSIDCSEFTTVKYFGFFSKTETSYSTSVVYDIPAESLTDLNTAFTDILSSRDWTVKTSSAIKETNGIYTFDAKKQTGGFKRTVILNEAKSILFKVQTNLNEQFDGSLQFLIDDKVVASYSGKNSLWQYAMFQLEPGMHTIEWKRTDTSSSFSADFTPSVSVKDMAFGDAVPEDAPTDLSTAFDSILKSYYWTLTNSGALSEFNGVYTFDGKEQTGGFKRKVVLTQDKTIRFKVQTNLFEQYDGCLQFLIDGEVLASYTGKDGMWENAVFDITAGTHTIEWKRYDTDSRWTRDMEQTVSVKDMVFADAVQPLTEINQNFESNLDTTAWIGAGFSAFVIDKDPVYSKWVQYGDALTDIHGKVFKLGTYENDKPGDSSLKINKIKVEEESALSFDYKCDLWPATYLCVYIDNSTEPAFKSTGNRTIWQKGSVVIPAGTHSIKFASYKTSSTYSKDLTNAIYLDNITLAPNKIASVDISPKGLQETYAGGDTIQFTAKALRSDGSEISGKEVTWSATDGSIDEKGVFTPGSSSGTVTVTATIDGKSASNQTVKVHGTDYLYDSVTLNGKEFKGYKPARTTSISTTNIKFTGLQSKSFSADGFFVLSGTATEDFQVEITKGSYKTYYFIPKGNFAQRIWLRFGEGSYTIFIAESSGFSYFSPSGNYQGDLSGFGSYKTSGPTTCTLNVTNTNNSLSADEACLLLPSSWCQCDDFRITNAVNGIMAELPENATVGQKLQALHDWEIHRMYYDYDSFNYPKRRKAQDALHVLLYNMGVCEGYANLFTALERVIGVKGTVVCAQYNAHAWNNTYYNGSWLLLDSTWDDPSADDKLDKQPLLENYTYFLLTKSQDSQTSNNHGSLAIPDSTKISSIVGGDGINNMRSAIPVDSDTTPAPYIRGMPDGWY